MRSNRGEPGRVWWHSDWPNRDLIMLALCLGGASIVLFTLQSLSAPASPAGTVATEAPVGLDSRRVVPSGPPTRSSGLRREKPRSPAAPPAAPSKAPRPPSISGIEEEILRLTNIERASSGLPPLAHDPDLDAIARAHSRDMVARDFFSHENPSGDGPTERAEKAGYDVHKPVRGGELVGIGENIGTTPTGEVEDVGFVEREAHSIAAAQIRGWMSRRGHRSNILSSEYERIGVGVAYDGKGAYVCTQVFW